MAQALFDRLGRVFDDSVKTTVMSRKQPAGPAGAWVRPPSGAVIADVKVFVLHETSGWSARTGTDMAHRRFWRPPGPGETDLRTGEYTQFLISGDGTVFECIEAIAQPRQTGHANFVNDWALGSETGHSWGNYRGNHHLGPHSQSNHTRNPDGTPTPQYGRFEPLHAMPGNRWIPLSGDLAENAAPPGPDVDDVPGLKIWFRWLGFNEVVVGWWTTERYTGPWREPQRVPEMLFSEWQYRSWALLLRYAAERYLIPRNFSLLPHKTRSPGAGAAAGQHGMLQDAASFRAIVLADEVLSRSLAELGAPGAALTEADLAAGDRYRAAFTNAGVDRNEMWTRAMRLFRGFHGHGYSGDPGRGHDHDCPGPMFDWHRLAREVWDWWWHPFDFNAARTSTNVPRRPYSPRWDGNTRLTEHYYDTPEQPYLGRSVPGIHGDRGSPRTYRLEQGSPVYALAAGDLMAARFPAETGQVSLAFIVVRHEVFHQVHPLAGTEFWPGIPLVFPDRIDYDVEPSIVYSLYMHLGRPPGMSFVDVVDANPDWLNRLLMRKREADLGWQYHEDEPHAPAGWTVPNVAWNSQPPALRPTILEGWTADHGDYGPMLQRLARGDVMLAPTDVFATPIRVLLGDFLGMAGVIRRDGAASTHGIRVEVFSRNLISPDFTLFTTDVARGWSPTRDTLPPAVQYPSEWARVPAGAEQATLQAAGVDVNLVQWWSQFHTATTWLGMLPNPERLDAAGNVVHYEPDSFMRWLNRRTWRSEWPKYRVTDPAGIPDAPRPRPAA